MKQQLRSTLRTFCFLVEITEVMNDHEYICRSGKWELWAWHLGNCTAHGHEQHIPDLYTGIHWHQLSPGTADLLLEIRAKCHMQVLEVATLQENISFLFSCQGNEKTQWWKHVCSGMSGRVWDWMFLKLKQRNLLCNTQVLFNCGITK